MYALSTTGGLQSDANAGQQHATDSSDAATNGAAATPTGSSGIHNNTAVAGGSGAAKLTAATKLQFTGMDAATNAEVFLKIAAQAAAEISQHAAAAPPPPHWGPAIVRAGAMPSRFAELVLCVPTAEEVVVVPLTLEQQAKWPALSRHQAELSGARGAGGAKVIPASSRFAILLGYETDIGKRRAAGRTQSADDDLRDLLQFLLKLAQTRGITSPLYTFEAVRKGTVIEQCLVDYGPDITAAATLADGCLAVGLQASLVIPSDLMTASKPHSTIILRDFNVDQAVDRLVAEHGGDPALAELEPLSILGTATTLRTGLPAALATHQQQQQQQQVSDGQAPKEVPAVQVESFTGRGIGPADAQVLINGPSVAVAATGGTYARAQLASLAAYAGNPAAAAHAAHWHRTILECDAALVSAAATAVVAHPTLEGVLYAAFHRPAAAWHWFWSFPTLTQRLQMQFLSRFGVFFALALCDTDHTPDPALAAAMPVPAAIVPPTGAAAMPQVAAPAPVFTAAPAPAANDDDDDVYDVAQNLQHLQKRQLEQEARAAARTHELLEEQRAIAQRAAAAHAAATMAHAVGPAPALGAGVGALFAGGAALAGPMMPLQASHQTQTKTQPVAAAAALPAMADDDDDLFAGLPPLPAAPATVVQRGAAGGILGAHELKGPVLGAGPGAKPATANTAQGNPLWGSGANTPHGGAGLLQPTATAASHTAPAAPTGFRALTKPSTTDTDKGLLRPPPSATAPSAPTASTAAAAPSAAKHDTASTTAASASSKRGRDEPASANEALAGFLRELPPLAASVPDLASQGNKASTKGPRDHGLQYSYAADRRTLDRDVLRAAKHSTHWWLDVIHGITGAGASAATVAPATTSTVAEGSNPAPTAASVEALTTAVAQLSSGALEQRILEAYTLRAAAAIAAAAAPLPRDSPLSPPLWWVSSTDAATATREGKDGKAGTAAVVYTAHPYPVRGDPFLQDHDVVPSDPSTWRADLATPVLRPHLSTSNGLYYFKFYPVAGGSAAGRKDGGSSTSGIHEKTSYRHPITRREYAATPQAFLGAEMDRLAAAVTSTANGPDAKHPLAGVPLLCWIEAAEVVAAVTAARKQEDVADARRRRFEAPDAFKGVGGVAGLQAGFGDRFPVSYAAAAVRQMLQNPALLPHLLRLTLCFARFHYASVWFHDAAAGTRGPHCYTPVGRTGQRYDKPLMTTSSDWVAAFAETSIDGAATFAATLEPLVAAIRELAAGKTPRGAGPAPKDKEKEKGAAEAKEAKEAEQKEAGGSDESDDDDAADAPSARLVRLVTTDHGLAHHGGGSRNNRRGGNRRGGNNNKKPQRLAESEAAADNGPEDGSSGASPQTLAMAAAAWRLPPTLLDVCLWLCDQNYRVGAIDACVAHLVGITHPKKVRTAKKK